MIQTTALIVERRPLAPNLSLLWLRAPELSRSARPGQFLMLRATAGLDPYLSRPFFIHRLRDGEAGEEFALLIKERGTVSRLLANAAPGQRVTALGPLGRPLVLRPGVRQLLLIAEGVFIAPLIWLADEETARGRSVTLLHGSATAEDLYPLSLIGPEVELDLATTDGSQGRPGSVLDLLPEYLSWADQVFISGPDALGEAVAGLLRRELWRRPCELLLQRPLACGTGICAGCPVPMRRGAARLLCREGPAFALGDLA